MVAMIVIYGSRQTVVFGAGTTTDGTGVSQAGELSSEGRTGFCYVLACVELVVRDHILAIRE